MSRRRVGAIARTVALVACGGGGDEGMSDGSAGAGAGNPGASLADFCTTKPFTPPAQSPYRLPYEVGSSYVMFQGNCPAHPAWGHYGKFAYDFEQPIGTPVHAMRGGTVIFTEDRYLNSDHACGHENGVWIEHDDGTVADYLHFSPSSVVVVTATKVQAGDLPGFSGDSGGSDRPHLHVEAFANRNDYSKPNTIPLTFNNAGGITEARGELIQGNAYAALDPP
jgi:murein DD-endopeptidase MepM/ murein hydrolase activator NlpD